MEITSLLQVPTISNIKASVLVNTPVLSVLFIVFFIFYFLISSVLVYHWSSYGMKSRGVIFAESIFVFVSLVLFVIAGMSLYYF